MITGIDAFEFTAQDKPRMIAFYRDVLGLTPTDEDEHGAEFAFADGTTLAIWKPETDDYPTGPAVMFAVEDIDEAVGYFRGRGAVLSDVVATRVCFMSFGRDPEGNRFVVHQRKDPG